MRIDLHPDKVSDLTLEERANLVRLLEIYQGHITKNAEKEKYYEGRIRLSEVNLGIALPEGMGKLKIGCAWGAKTVDALAARSMWDGFVGVDGAPVDELTAIVDANNLIAKYSEATRDELKLGCTFATVLKDDKSGSKIRFYSPSAAAGLWDGDKDRLTAGFAVVSTMKDREGINRAWRLYYFTESAVIVLTRMDRDQWIAQRFSHRMGQPLMVPMIWNATSNKPLGRSRLKEPIRELINGYVRTMANASIALEFSTAPQKYLMGVSDQMYDKLINSKFEQYVGSIIAGTTNPDTGEKPTFGQLPQGTLSPHTEMLRDLATQFSAATGLPAHETGVITDANPSSSDAIIAQTQTIVKMAEELNAGNGQALRTIALMALAISRDVSLDELTEQDRAIVPHFKNPAMPSIAATADAAVKIASARPEFAQTDVFLEMNGFSQAEVRRIKAQEQRARGLALAEQIV